MKKRYAGPWNAARWSATHPVKQRVTVKPIENDLRGPNGGYLGGVTCSLCGYHQCNCAESGALAKGLTAETDAKPGEMITWSFAVINPSADDGLRIRAALEPAARAFAGEPPKRDLSMMLTPRSR